MTTEAVLSLISVCATVTLAIGGGAVKICAKLEKLNTSIANLVTREQCFEQQKRCRQRLANKFYGNKKR